MIQWYTSHRVESKKRRVEDLRYALLDTTHTLQFALSSAPLPRLRTPGHLSFVKNLDNRRDHLYLLSRPIISRPPILSFLSLLRHILAHAQVSTSFLHVGKNQVFDVILLVYFTSYFLQFIKCLEIRIRVKFLRFDLWNLDLIGNFTNRRRIRVLSFSKIRNEKRK